MTTESGLVARQIRTSLPVKFCLDIPHKDNPGGLGETSPQFPDNVGILHGGAGVTIMYVNPFLTRHLLPC